MLVLGGGGLIGQEWLIGMLAGIEDATGFDLRECEYFVGTSAGSIVSARLMAGRPLRRPDATASGADGNGPPAAPPVAPTPLRRAGQWTLAAWGPLAPFALRAGAGPGALLRASVLRQAPRPDQTLDDLRRYVARDGARFDGRLRVTAVDRHTGHRVVFGSPGAPTATVAEAVEASCAVPWLFAPVVIGRHEYVDGGVWSATNLDVAPAGRDTHVLCLNPMAGVHGSASVLSIARRVSRSAVSVEALALRRRGATVHVVGPDPSCAAVMGVDFMNPEPRARVLAAGYRQGREFGRRDAWER